MKMHVEQDEVTTVCCVCGTHIKGPRPAGADVSHGYCRFHFLAAMQDIQRFHARIERQQSLAAPALAA